MNQYTICLCGYSDKNNNKSGQQVNIINIKQKHPKNKQTEKKKNSDENVQPVCENAIQHRSREHVINVVK